MLPTLTGTGRLTYDPELTVTQSGMAVCTVQLAFNSRRKNPQTQEWEDGDVFYVRGTCFKALAENVAETLQRGMEVNFSGTVRTERWEKDGVKREATKLIIDAIGPNLAYAVARVAKSERSNGQQSSPQQRQQPAQQQYGTGSQTQQQQPPQRQQQPQDDPWSVPASSDEPPF